jgi:hypothetical protein
MKKIGVMERKGKEIKKKKIGENNTCSTEEKKECTYFILSYEVAR